MWKDCGLKIRYRCHDKIGYMGITGGVGSRRCTHSYQLLIDSSVNHFDYNYGLLMLTAAKKLASAAHD